VTTRIAILWPQTSGFWTAGAIYTENLLKSVLLAEDSSCEVVVLEPHGGEFAANHRSSFPDIGYRSFDDQPARSLSARAGSRVRRAAGLPTSPLARAIRDARVDVVFGNLDGDASRSVRWVGWIPDFQHMHYPEFFAPGEVAGRDSTYMQWAQECTLMLLSSHDCEKDFRSFAPHLGAKARVAPFVSLFPDKVFAADPAAVKEELGIVGPYVVVPNQWWRHKNHETAFRAARLLRDRGVGLTWVLTGALQDHRDPKYASQMLQLISQLGIGDTVRPLGMLPRLQQMQLMRGADLVVQPSLFEGWSTVVEDVKTIGQRIVLSDIAVHREQAPPHALYFDPLSPDALADAVSSTLGGAIDRAAEAASRSAALERARTFGERFLSICTEAARV